MKIALVSPYDLAVPGGVNSHVHHLAENFNRLGHEVRVIGPSSDLSCLDENTIAIGRPLAIAAGGSIARMNMAPRLARPIRRILREEAFDVVHVHEPLVSFLPIQFLRFSNAINVGTFHAARDNRARLYTYTRRLLRGAFRRLDGKIAVSAAAMRLVQPHFPGYYNLIPNGVDVERFSAAYEPLPGLDDGKVNILFVGRLEKRKGLRYLLRAFADLKPRLPDTRLVVVGAYDERQRRGYERWVRESGLRDVVFAGYASLEDLPRYHASSHIFCAPNTGNESQGIVLLEAMAAGLPVVASNIEGFAAVLTDGVEGLLVRPKASDALASALYALARDPELRAAMGERGRARAQHFSWERISRRVLSYYERLAYEKRLARGGLPELVEA
ncbi:MAG TPA: glycosyltransferase family 4 protein [Dehalococcoidia bacterium]|nr:glycosyltransferase family 4 protein [Dehalococcoidia bacterium]